MTASRAVSGNSKVSVDTRAKVLREAERLGYRPNLSGRSLRTNRTELIGVFSPNLMMPLQVEVVLGARDAAAREGYRLLLDVDETHDKGVPGFTSDGNLMIDAPASQLSMKVDFDPARTVLLMHQEPTCPVDACVTDLDRSTFAAIRHLVSSGYHRIAMLIHAGSPAMKGYEDAVEEFGISRDEDLVQVVANDSGTVGQAIDKLTSLPEQPDAIIVVNVAATPLALRSLGRRGIRVGKDLGFVGTEGSRAEWGDLVSPNLTSIRVPGYEIGAAGARRLIERLRGDVSPPATMTFPSEFIVRGSTPHLT